ncbi:MAG: hypothetical protein Q8R28_20450, partial [Dehalococcoidia bacterium]|nr:hypothetical protein [Dehalococcoidia bacterium]
MLYRYSYWDGSQEFESLEADELMDSISDELLSEGDLRSILKRITRWGMDRPVGERFSGLQDLLKRLQKQRQEQLERYKLDSVLDDIKKRLEGIVQKEREGIDKRLNENRESLAEKGDDSQGLHQL